MGVTFGSIVGVIVGIVAIVVITLQKHRKRGKIQSEDMNNMQSNQFQCVNYSVPTKLLAIKNVKIQTAIGDGNFGTVYLGEWDGAKVAAKKLKGQEEWKAFAREAELLEYYYSLFLFILSSMRHPNVLTCLGIYTDAQDEKYIITEYMNQGSLISLLRQNQLTNEQKLDMQAVFTFSLTFRSIQCCRALVHLETTKCVHRFGNPTS